MKWLAALGALFTRKSDPLAPLREEPSWELRMAELMQMESDYLLDALRRGRIDSHPANNAAPGTYGAALVDAVQRGLMCVTIRRSDRIVYETTAAGKRYLAENS